ncbi:MAG: gamma carbonic anhydrase family protein, partial [Thermoanaerobaculia bacterium]
IYIGIGALTTVQEKSSLPVGNCDSPTIFHDEVPLALGAMGHGCTVHRGALIGMGSRVLDKAVIGENALIGAGALVPEGMIVPPRVLVVGVPARVKRPLTDEEVARLEESWRLYVGYKNNYLNQR